MNYKVVNPIKERQSPSMYEPITKPNLTVGYTFESLVTVSLVPNPPIAGQNPDPIVWVQLPDGFYAPMVYRGITYIVELAAPPVEGTPFSLAVEGYKVFNGTLEPED